MSPKKSQQVDPSNLHALIDRAAAERWTELALVADVPWLWSSRSATSARQFRFSGRLGSLDAAFARLSQLAHLSLRGLDLGAEGARALAALTNLTSLDLRDNSIGDEGARALLEMWRTSTSAQRLQLGSNAVTLLPESILATGDAQQVLATYREYAAVHSKDRRPMREAKLLVVGREDVGKTSLVRYLIDDTPCNPHEPKTRGVQHERIDTRQWPSAGVGVTLNVWDFGGQEVMKGTHKFFLTQRSLYLLVLSDRREDDSSVRDWLRIVHGRAPSAPVIVVINKSDDGKEDLRLDELALKRDFPSIAGFARTSCVDSAWARQSVGALRQKIASIVGADPHLIHARELYLPSWLRVKEKVAGAAKERSVLPRGEFQRLCEEDQQPISDLNAQAALLGLLHDLGTVFASAPAAHREISLLDPNWLTQAIYRLLNEAAIVKQGGEFSATQLGGWLNPTQYPEPLHEFILSMMQRDDVALCSALPDKRGWYLLPEALREGDPYSEHWPANSLRFRFRYDIVPRALMPRLIVLAHANVVPDRSTRTCTQIRAAGCVALVRAQPHDRIIDILVDGPPPFQRAALNFVVEQLSQIHERFPEAGPLRRVPLPDNPSVDVSYDHLLKLEHEEGKTHAYRPENANRKYTVGELLDGVRLDPRRETEQPTHARAREEIRETPHVSPKSPPPTPPAPWTPALAVGIGIAVLAALVLFLPSSLWRISLSFVLGATAIFVVRVWQGTTLYGRLVSFMLPVGPLAGAVGFTVSAATDSGTWFALDTAASAWYLAGWALVTVALIAADVVLRLPGGNRG